MDIINEWFHRFYPADLDQLEFRYCSSIYGRECMDISRRRAIFPSMVCADGATFSVQGHYGAYSTPRDDFADKYTSFEVLGPRIEDSQSSYETDIDDEWLYSYVPLERMLRVLEEHGGFDVEASLKRAEQQ